MRIRRRATLGMNTQKIGVGVGIISVLAMGCGGQSTVAPDNSPIACEQ
jgi:hypothetical protein